MGSVNISPVKLLVFICIVFFRKREYDTKGFAKNLGRGTSFSTEELELMNDSFFDKIENFMTMFELPRNVTYLGKNYKVFFFFSLFLYNKKFNNKISEFIKSHEHIHLIQYTYFN